MSDPNLQNIPVKTRLGRKVRRAFLSTEPRRARPGHPKDRCKNKAGEECGRHVDDCQCETVEHHPIGCICHRCGPDMGPRSW